MGPVDAGEVDRVTHSDAIREKRAAYRQALEEALERIRGRLAESPQVQRAILFGSYASGRRDLFTDLDLVVVMESDSSFIDRSVELRRHLEAGVDMDLFVYTPEEFARMAQRGFLAEVLKTGLVIYEKNAA